MKKFRFIILFAILSFILAALFTASVCAAPSAYVIEGEKTVFLSNEPKVTYNSAEYETFSRLADAFSALGSDGGKAIVCGSFSPDDNVNDPDFKDPSGRGPVIVTGLNGAEHDSLNQSATLDFSAGKITFDNVTLSMMKTKYFSAPDLVMTENFRVSKSGGSLFMTGLLSGSKDKITQTISSGIFDQINLVGMGGATLGTASAPGYASITINGGDINTKLNGGSGYSNATVYGNLYYIINGGNYTDKSIVYNKLLHQSGRKIVIFNNGMSDGFSVADGACVVKSAAGGTVSVDSATAADEEPLLVFTPEEGKIPAVGGSAVFIGSDGRYTMPLGSASSYDISWIEKVTGGCIIDGVKTVFLSNDESVTFNGITFVPFSSLTDAFTALGPDGGKAIVCGSFSPDDNITDADFKDPAGRGPITVTGLNGAEHDSLNQSAMLNFKSGRLILDDITLSMMKTNYLSAPDLVITENFRVSKSSGVLYMTGLISGSTDKVNQVISSGTFDQINLVGMNKASLGSENEPGYASITINGGDINTKLNGGSGYSDATVYGNLYYIINGGNYSNKNIVYNKLLHQSGSKIVIFNNGMSDGFTVSDGACVVKSAAGGMVSVDSATAANEEPLLVFTPDGGRIPAINGKMLSAGEDGRYTEKVTGTGEYTVSWEERTAKVYTIEGIKTVFVSDLQNDVEYNGEKYVPYNSLTDAVANLGSGTVMIGGTYTYNGFTDTKARGTITVRGTDENSVIVFPADASSVFAFNGGPTVMDDITVNVESSNGKYIHGNGNIIFTKNFSSNSSLYISPIYSVNAQKSEIIVENGNFAIVDVISSNSQIGTPEAPSHASAHLNGGSFVNVNGGWGWAAKTMYGNLFIYVNGSHINGSVKFSSQETITGKKTVIFNNGMYLRTDGSEILVDDAYDFTVYADKGGFVSVENEDTTGNPVFILSPEDGRIPYVNGIPAEMTDGIYSYAPQSEKEKISVQWRKNYTVIFDANGAEGNVPQPITEISGVTYPLPQAPELEKTNCIFAGWHTDPNAREGFYSLTLTADTKLYAIWIEKLPLLSEFPNLEANGIKEVKFSYIPTNDSLISSAVKAAKSDPVFMSTASEEAVYSFGISAYSYYNSDGNDGNKLDFENGINFVIPQYAYSREYVPGEFLRLYRADGDSAQFVGNLRQTEDGIDFCAYKSGNYFVMLNIPDIAQYRYAVSNADGNVKVNVYFSGAKAQSGFFGIKYNPETLDFKGFDYAPGIYSAGQTEKADGGYGCFVSDSGIYGDAWAGEKYIDAVSTPTLIGTLNFTAKDGASSDNFAFAPALPSEYGASEYEKFPQGAESAYLPYYESAECIYQPAAYIISSARALIGEKEYQSLSDALAQAQNGDTVQLISDKTLSGRLTVPDGVTFEICRGASVSGEKIVLSHGASAVSYSGLYSSFCSDTLVGVRKEGEKYIYKASDISSDILALDGVQIRLSGVQGLRFIAKISSSVENSGFSDYGILIIPSDLSQGENTTLDTKMCANISYKELGNEFKYFEVLPGSFRYTVCITGIAVRNYARDFTARPYIKYTDDDGEYTVYADYRAEYDLSVTDVARGLIAGGDENSDELQKIIEEYEDYINQSGS